MSFNQRSASAPPGTAARGEGVVTVVVAAYGRPQVLNKTLQTVYRQTREQWRVLIVADCCPPAFVSQIDLSDERVRLINLPTRCGNQYGPNSVGIHLAETGYVAFLNHDDAWLADHLEIAVHALRENRADFFLGTAAFCHPRNQAEWSHREGRLVFSELNGARRIWRCMVGPSPLFEPASSWVLSTPLAKRVGSWQPPDSAYGSPLLDWLRRAARAGAAFCFSDEVTVLKLNLHHDRDPKTPIYEQEDALLRYLDFYIDNPPGVGRERIGSDVAMATNRDLLVRPELLRPSEMTQSELDIVSSYRAYLAGGPSPIDRPAPAELDGFGDFARETLAKRTGERLDRFITPEELIRQLTPTGAGQ